MANRRPPSKLAAIINEARLMVEDPESSTQVTHMLLTKPWLRRLARAGCRMQLLSAGILLKVGQHLKTNRDDATEQQYELWPQAHRSLVRDINRARVYVPSAAQYVPLDPAHITPRQTTEAGQYLVDKGQDCIRVGNLLLKLGKFRW